MNAETELLWWHGAAVLTCIVALASTGQSDVRTFTQSEKAQLDAFKRQYLPPYLLATFCDWIQGPYQFKVYLTYGLNEEQIGKLYIAGFGASLTLGTYIASLADSKGRRMGCVWYCVVCALSCMTKNSPNYWVLMGGRVLGGVATSLLFATFESWCVTEASRKALPSKCLASLFTTASFLNGLTAICASLLGHVLVVFCGGVVAPFNAVPLVLAACAYFMCTRWAENYGGEAGDDTGGSLVGGLKFMFSQPKLPLLGLIGSLFDAALYIFIFLWTLSLERRSTDPTRIPYGIAFALFMGWCMIGALVCQMALCDGQGAVALKATKLMLVLLVLACCGLLPCVEADTSYTMVFNGFCLLEFAFGAYSPAIALLRAHHLDDSHRTAVTAIYRTPTNLSVCLILFYAGSIPESTEIQLCMCLLVIAIMANVVFLRLESSKGSPCEAESPRDALRVVDPSVKARVPPTSPREV